MVTYRRSTITVGILSKVEKRVYHVRLRCAAAFFRLGSLVLTFFFIFSSSRKCRKSMARIKYVINERRLAYEGAMKIHAEKMKQAAKEGQKKVVEAERRDSADIMHQEQKVSPPVSETTQAAVDGLLQRSST